MLVVDEVSMLDGEMFDKVEAVACAMGDASQPFGGVQLILCGDFYQLPPVGTVYVKCKYGGVQLYYAETFINCCL